VCQACPNGSQVCAQSACVKGQCSTSFPACAGGGAGGNSAGGCKASIDCPITDVCKMCPDGSCASAIPNCVSGRCTQTFAACPSSGAPQWYMTCGLPVCRVPPADGGGGSSGGIAACDPGMGEKAGASCKTIDAECNPGSACGEMLVCTTSDPTHGGVCPKSRAMYKTQIEYVDPVERARLAADLQTIPLVRYRYKDAPDRSHLGFIIEDVEPSPSVDSQRDQVDLYGYASMAVAAIQEQSKEIAELRREVEGLKVELRRRGGKR